MVDKKYTIGGSIGVILVILISSTLYLSNYREILESNPDKMYFVGLETKLGILNRAQVVIRNGYWPSTSFTRYQIDRDFITMYSDRSIVARFRPEISYYKTYGEDEWVKLTRKRTKVKVNYYEDLERKEVTIERVIPYYGTASVSGTGGTLYENFTLGQNTYKITYYWEPYGNRINYNHTITINVHELEELNSGEFRDFEAQFWEGEIPILIDWKGTEEYFNHTEIDGDEFNMVFTGKGEILLDPRFGVKELYREASEFAKRINMTEEVPVEKISFEYIDEPFLIALNEEWNCINRNQNGLCAFFTLDFEVGINPEVREDVDAYVACENETCKQEIADIYNETVVDMDSRIDDWEHLSYEVVEGFFIPVVTHRNLFDYNASFSLLNVPEGFEFKIGAHSIVVSGDTGGVYSCLNSMVKFRYDSAGNNYGETFQLHAFDNSSDDWEWLSYFNFGMGWEDAGNVNCFREETGQSWLTQTDEECSLFVSCENSGKHVNLTLSVKRGSPNIKIKAHDFAPATIDVMLATFHAGNYDMGSASGTAKFMDLIYFPNGTLVQSTDSNNIASTTTGNTDKNYFLMANTSDDLGFVVSFDQDSDYTLDYSYRLGTTYQIRGAWVVDNDLPSGDGWDNDTSNKTFWWTPLMNIDAGTNTNYTDDSFNDGTIDNLESLWKLDSSTGSTATDSGPGGFDGTLTNMEDPGDWKQAWYKNGLDFDGSNEYIEIDSWATGRAADTVGTISAWIYVVDRDEFYAIISASDLTDAQSWMALILRQTTGILQLTIEENNDNHCTLRSVGTVGIGAWHHVAVTKDATNGILLYIDAVNQTLTEASGDATTCEWLNHINDIDDGKIAVQEQSGGIANYFDGMMDDVRYYSRALNQGEITALYEGLPDCFDSDIGCAYWNYNSGSASLPNGSWAEIASQVSVSEPTCGTDSNAFTALINETDGNVVLPYQNQSCSFAFAGDDWGTNATANFTLIPYYNISSQSFTSYIPFMNGSQYFGFNTPSDAFVRETPVDWDWTWNETSNINVDVAYKWLKKIFWDPTWLILDEINISAIYLTFQDSTIGEWDGNLADIFEFENLNASNYTFDSISTFSDGTSQKEITVNGSTGQTEGTITLRIPKNATLVNATINITTHYGFEKLGTCSNKGWYHDVTFQPDGSAMWGVLPNGSLNRWNSVGACAVSAQYPANETLDGGNWLFHGIASNKTHFMILNQDDDSAYSWKFYRVPDSDVGEAYIIKHGSGSSDSERDLGHNSTNLFVASGTGIAFYGLDWNSSEGSISLGFSPFGLDKWNVTENFFIMDSNGQMYIYDAGGVLNFTYQTTYKPGAYGVQFTELGLGIYSLPDYPRIIITDRTHLYQLGGPQLPDDVYVDVGNDDSKEWTYSGEFPLGTTKNATGIMVALQNEIEYCDTPVGEYCDITVAIGQGADKAGNLTIHYVDLDFTVGNIGMSAIVGADASGGTNHTWWESTFGTDEIATSHKFDWLSSPTKVNHSINITTNETGLDEISNLTFIFILNNSCADGYCVDANAFFNASFMGGNHTDCVLWPDSPESDCDSGSPTYQAFGCYASNLFHVCREDVDGDDYGVSEYIAVIQEDPGSNVSYFGGGDSDNNPPIYSGVLNSTNNSRPDILFMNCTWTENEGSITEVFFETNHSGSDVNYTLAEADVKDLTGGKYSYEIAGNTLDNQDMIQWKCMANDSSNNWNITMPYEYPIVCNLIPPTPTFSIPIDYHNTSDPTPTLKWKNSTDPDADILGYFLEIVKSDASYSVNSSIPYYDNNTGWSPDISSGGDGTYKWRVKATDNTTRVQCADQSQNSSWTAYQTLILDRVAPTADTIENTTMAYVDEDFDGDIVFNCTYADTGTGVNESYLEQNITSTGAVSNATRSSYDSTQSGWVVSPDGAFENQEWFSWVCLVEDFAHKWGRNLTTGWYDGVICNRQPKFDFSRQQPGLWANISDVTPTFTWTNGTDLDDDILGYFVGLMKNDTTYIKNSSIQYHDWTSPDLTSYGDGIYTWGMQSSDSTVYQCQGNHTNSTFSTAQRPFILDTDAPLVTNFWNTSINNTENNTVTVNCTATEDDITVDSVLIAGNWTGSFENLTTTKSGDNYEAVIQSTANNFTNQEVFAWTCIANNTATPTLWNVTEPWNYVIVHNRGPNTPTGLTPADYYNSSSSTVTFTWTNGTDLDDDARGHAGNKYLGHYLEIVKSDNSWDFNSTVFYNESGGDAVAIAGGDGTYVWRMKTTDQTVYQAEGNETNSTWTAYQTLYVDTTIPGPVVMSNETTAYLDEDFDSYEVNCTWTEVFYIDTCYFEHNGTGTLTNYSGTRDGSNPRKFYATLDISSRINTQKFSWKCIANDTANNWNVTVLYQEEQICNRIPNLDFSQAGPAYGSNTTIAKPLFNWTNGTDFDNADDGNLTYYLELLKYPDLTPVYNSTNQSDNETGWQPPVNLTYSIEDGWRWTIFSTDSTESHRQCYGNSTNSTRAGYWTFQMSDTEPAIITQTQRPEGDVDYRESATWTLHTADDKNVSRINLSYCVDTNAGSPTWYNLTVNASISSPNTYSSIIMSPNNFTVGKNYSWYWVVKDVIGQWSLGAPVSYQVQNLTFALSWASNVQTMTFNETGTDGNFSSDYQTTTTPKWNVSNTGSCNEQFYVYLDNDTSTCMDLRLSSDSAVSNSSQVTTAYTNHFNISQNEYQGLWWWLEASGCNATDEWNNSIIVEIWKQE